MSDYYLHRHIWEEYELDEALCRRLAGAGIYPDFKEISLIDGTPVVDALKSDRPMELGALRDVLRANKRGGVLLFVFQVFDCGPEFMESIEMWRTRYEQMQKDINKKNTVVDGDAADEAGPAQLFERVSTSVAQNKIRKNSGFLARDYNELKKAVANAVEAYHRYGMQVGIDDRKGKVDAVPVALHDSIYHCLRTLQSLFESKVAVYDEVEFVLGKMGPLALEVNCVHR